MIAFHYFIVLIVVGLLVGAPSESNAGDTANKSKRTLYIKGALDRHVLAALNATHWGDIGRVSVTSFGGDAQDSIAIARVIKSANKPILISEYCMSGCLYIAMIRGRVQIMPGTVIFEHNSPTAVYYMINRYYPNIGNRFKLISNDETEWLRENSVDLRYAYIPTLMMQPRCVAGPRRDVEADFRQVLFLAKFSAWDATGQDLSRLGLQGFHPSTDITSIHRKYPGVVPSQVTIARLPPALLEMSIPELQRKISQTRQCRKNDFINWSNIY